MDHGGNDGIFRDSLALAVAAPQLERVLGYTNGPGMISRLNAALSGSSIARFGLTGTNGCIRPGLRSRVTFVPFLPAVLLDP